MADLLTELGLAEPGNDLTDAIRVRVDRELLDGLDRVEAFAKGLGYREVNRSSLIRAAIAGFIDGIEEEFPAIADLSLPPRRTGD